MKLYIYSIFISVFFIACFPEDSIIPAVNNTGAIIGSSGEFSMYEDQIYFSLDNNSIIKTIDQLSWDLALSCEKEQFFIKLNYAKIMSIYPSDKNFEEINREDALAVEPTEWTYDKPDGSLENTAIGKWWDDNAGSVISKNITYILNRGPSVRSAFKRYVKIKFEDYQNAYKITYQFLDNESEQVDTEITKDNDYNFVGFDFDSNRIKTIEPKNDSWDLNFTNFTEFLITDAGDTIVYAVKSALINGNTLEAAAAAPDTLEALLGRVKTFDEITIEDALQFEYTNAQNIIGHDWKQVDISTSQYTVRPEKIYFIRKNQIYYKFHFIDYYYNGERGYPKFRYEIL